MIGFFTSDTVGKEMARDTTTVSSKHQVTIPAEAFVGAGLAVGDRLRARSDGAGRVVLEKVIDPVATFAGSLTTVYDGLGVDDLRGEWE